jgi:hypothetical protein
MTFPCVLVGQTEPRPGALPGEPVRHAVPRGDGQQPHQGGHAGVGGGAGDHQLWRQRRWVPAPRCGARRAARHQVYHTPAHALRPRGESNQ